MAALGFTLFVLTSTSLAFQTSSAAIGGLTTPWANISTVWKIRVLNLGTPGAGRYQHAAGPWLLRPLAVPGTGMSFGAGFYCVSPCNTFIFGVYAISTGNQTFDGWYKDAVQVVWSANSDRKVQQNATLSFTGDGDLILQDADGSFVWSSNTAGRSVVGMNMTDSGNLVLFDGNNSTPVWQSFDYPVDSLLPGEKLLVGKALVPSMSSDNKPSTNQFHFTLSPDGFYAFYGYQEPRLFYYKSADPNRLKYATLTNGSLDVTFAGSRDEAYAMYFFQISRSLQFVRFEDDGHLRLYQWIDTQWKVTQDVLELDQCNYPSVCGEYGICSGGQCSCPMASNASGIYFRQLDEQRPDLGCILNTPISCQSIEDHRLIAVSNVSYFNYIDQNAGVLTDEDSCKSACLGNCSCRAALFQYDKDPANGSCLLVPEVLSLVGGSSIGTAFLKVQISHPPHSAKKIRVLLIGVGGGIAALVLLATIFAIIRWRQNEEKADEDEFSDLPGMPARFTFQSLQVATKDFSSNIGEGGFGSVFKGDLDNQLVAVKHLHQADQGTKEFLAEVQTIGSLHHINLVRLIGFRMRGTPGYMAPEWLTSKITEKVDVYSFGVVVMEIISGRKNLDYSQPEDSIQLISLLQDKAKNGKLEEMIDRNSEDMRVHKEEVIGMMNLAIWCLQSDSSRRPAMSLVVKVMEGERQVEPNLEYNFFDLSALMNAVPVGEANLSTLPIASELSSPR